METVQVLLVGGRQAPNVIGTLLTRPQYVEFIVSQDEQARVKDLIESLKGLNILHLPEDWVVVDAHDYQECADVCRKLIEKHSDKTVEFNLTGGTKIMAFAAYDVARHFQAKAFYINTAKTQIVGLVGENKTTQHFRLTITEYLSAYGRHPHSTFDFVRLTFSQSQAIETAKVLALGSRDAANLLYQIRTIQGAGERIITLDQTSPEYIVAEDLINLGVVDRHSKGIIVRSNEDWNFFKGDWLEAYTWHEAKSQVNAHGQPLFDDCFLGLEIPSDTARKEIDVACLYQAQLVHCSCKTDKKPFDTAYLDELTAVSSLIGGRFCSRVFITNATFVDEKQSDTFMAQAKQREIIVVTGDDLHALGSILAEQAEKPDYPRV